MIPQFFVKEFTSKQPFIEKSSVIRGKKIKEGIVTYNSLQNNASPWLRLVPENVHAHSEVKKKKKLHQKRERGHYQREGGL